MNGTTLATSSGMLIRLSGMEAHKTCLKMLDLFFTLHQTSEALHFDTTMTYDVGVYFVVSDQASNCVRTTIWSPWLRYKNQRPPLFW
jgi:hypothetical protein